MALGSDGPINPYLNVMFVLIDANNPASGDDARAGGRRLHTRLGARGDDGDDKEKSRFRQECWRTWRFCRRDIFTVPPEALPATFSVLTIVGGTVVHEGK